MEATKQVIYLKKLFVNLLHPEIAERSKIYIAQLPLIIYEDNRAAIRYIINPSGESSMKHLEAKIFWLHDARKCGDLDLAECNSEDMLADSGTKDNYYPIFISLVNRIMS